MTKKTTLCHDKKLSGFVRANNIGKGRVHGGEYG